MRQDVELNEQQRQAVEESAGRLLVLAGAGTGKTRVLTARVARFLQLDPHCRVLAVTFTNKAAREMEERLGAVCAASTSRLMVRTIHAFGAWVLRRHAEKWGLNPRFSVYDTQDSLALLRPLGLEKRTLNRYLNLIHRLRETGAAAENLADFCDEPPFADCYHQYMRRLRASGNVDFSDLVCLPVELLRDFPDVRLRMQQQFSAVFVDEFQDTNVVQLRWLQLMVADSTSLTVVGDEDQSIYAFRGATVDNIVRFPDYFPGAKVLRLEVNYRSTAPILRLANEAIARNTFRLGKTLRPLHRQGGELPSLHVFSDQDEEARFAAEWFAQQPNRELAVLYRSNAQAYAFEQHFRSLGLPYRLLGGTSFFDYEEVKTLLCYLMFFLNPRDEVAFDRIVNRPSRGLGAVAQRRIRQCAGGDWLQGLRLCPLKGKAAAGRDALISLGQKVQHWLTDLSVADLLGELMVESGLWQHYCQIDEKEESERCPRLLQLQEMAQGAGKGVGDLLSFLEMAGLTGGGEERQSESRLILATLHSTKGLEFDRVLLSGMEEGIFPSGLSSSPADREEERRLFYVGATRARMQLKLSTCRRRFLYGRWSEGEPSSFLNGLGSDVLARTEDAVDPGCTDWKGKRVRLRDYGVGQVVEARFVRKNLMLTIRLENGRQVKIFPMMQADKPCWEEL